MNQLSRDECIQLGLSVPSVPLVAWATELLFVAKGRQERLQCRGVTASFLNEVRILIVSVGELETALTKSKVSPSPDVAELESLREEVSAYCREAKQIIKIEFGTCPETQAKGRLGIRAGRLLANLRRELECVVVFLREQAPKCAWLGVDENFLGVGDVLIGKLKKAQEKLDSACKALLPTLAEHCSQRGKLYDLCRKLVRIGQLEYLHEPEQAAAFNYTLLRRQLRAGSEVRAKTKKAVAR